MDGRAIFIGDVYFSINKGKLLCWLGAQILKLLPWLYLKPIRYLKLKFVWYNRVEDVISYDMVSHKMFQGNRMGHTEGSGERELVIIYVQRGIANAWDKPSFRAKEKIHPNGWKMPIIRVDSIVSLKEGRL